MSDKKEKTHFRKLKSFDYLGSWDLMTDTGDFKEIVATVKSASNKEIIGNGGRTSNEMVVHFEEYQPMIVNNTNLKALIKACESPYVEDWKGKKVNIFVAQVKAFGENHDALRVKPIPAVITKPNFTKELFEKAKKAKATIEKIKKAYNVSSEIEKEYKKYVEDGAGQ